MLVLAIDTSTDVVTVGLVALDGGDRPAVVLAEQARSGARQHGEQLMPAVLEVCAAGGRALASVGAVVCGVGPGPFTGLRVGLVSAASLGDALDVPVYGVCSLDAVAEQVAAHVRAAGGPADGVGGAVGDGGEPLLVVSDARRREVYWAAYHISRGARRFAGPAVDAPAALAERVAELGVRRVAGPEAGEHAELLGLPSYPVGVPSAAGLVAAARDDLRAGRTPPTLEPLYLRRPDAVPPSARKRVTVR